MSNEILTIPWNVSEFKGIKTTTIISSLFTTFLTELGFRNSKINGRLEYIYIKNRKVKIVDKHFIVSTFLNWLNDNFEKYIESDETIEDVKRSFANKIKVLISNEMLMMMETIEIVPHFDTKEECFFYFKNTIVKVTKDTITLIDYDNFLSYVFEDQIVDLDFEIPVMSFPKETIPYERFIGNIANNDNDRKKAFESVIGYMLHRFQNPSISKAVILLDENINELDAVMGGTGKSIFVKALSKLRPTCSIDGKNFKQNDSFAYQRLEGNENILVINDAQQNMDFESLYGKITDGFTINRKYKTECYIPFERSPKIIITSNYYLKAPTGDSTERRRYEIEFSKYYGKHLNVEKDFNHYFFNDWSTDQWNNFIYYMINCVQKYLQDGLVNCPMINILQRRLISEVGMELTEFMDQQLLTKRILNKKDLLADFTRGGYVSTRYLPTQRSFTIKVKKYFEYKEILYRETPLNTKISYEILYKETSSNYRRINFPRKK